MTIIANTKPLILKVDDHQGMTSVACCPYIIMPIWYQIQKQIGKAYYGSEVHKQHLDDQIAKVKEKVDPEFKMIAIQTDDENTMRRLRRKFNEVCYVFIMSSIAIIIPD